MSCPVKVRARLVAVVEAVRAAPPPAFSGCGKQIAIITGLVKANARLFTDSEYEKRVRRLGERYLASAPRPIAT
jgi:hypothetical protein